MNVTSSTKVCLRCQQEYQPRSNAQKYCPECCRERNKETCRGWYWDHKEEARRQNREWSLLNPEARKAIDRRASKKKYALNPARCNLLTGQWRKRERLKHSERIRMTDARHTAKRRVLGFNPLNSWFPGCEAHHINSNDVIHVPQLLHQSVKHSLSTGHNMDRINTLAGKYLAEDWT